MEKIVEYDRCHPDFPSYIITEDGKVFSKRAQKILSPSRDPRGYLYVDLFENGVRTKMRIHILVGETFYRKRVIGSEVIDHKDGNKLNNHKNNLEIVTYSENTSRAYRLGLVKGKVSRG